MSARWLTPCRSRPASTRSFAPSWATSAPGDPAWLSYLDTPLVPDHPSAHAVVGAAAAAVLARCFEADFISFTATSGDPYPGLARRFWSFSEAAPENGASRVLAGIHFPTAVRAGLGQGDEVGGLGVRKRSPPHRLCPAQGVRVPLKRSRGEATRRPLRNSSH